MQNAVDPGKPFVLTETGYHTSLTADTAGGWEGVDETIQAKLLLNTNLDAAQLGAKDTFVYELLDAYPDSGGSNQETHFGLFRLDNSPKPAAVAIHNLTSILHDGGADAATFSAGSLNYTAVGLPSTGHTLLTEKSDGSFDLIAWNEPDVWDQASDHAIAVGTTNVTIDLGQTFGTVQTFDPLIGTSAIQTFHNTSAVKIGVSDHPLIVQASAPANGSNPVHSIAGGAGNDRLVGTAANDAIFGRDGNDVLLGGSGNDSLVAGAGNDAADGSLGDDYIDLGYGNDAATGGEGNDSIGGGAGIDTIMGGNGNDNITGGTDTDYLSGEAGNDTIYGDDGNPNAGSIDYIDGGASDDILFDSGGADTIYGGDGADYLQGDAGDDVLKPGVGYDYLSGGVGADTFLFDQSGFQQDAIYDFTHGTDHLAISGSIFPTFAALQANTTQVGANTIINAGYGDVIVLANFTASTLTAGDVMIV